MKKNRGISLITLLITIIVIIIISSISVYNGVNLIKDARKKDAEVKLKTICSAIFKDDTFLDFDVDNTAELSERDYDYMDLLKYYDEDYLVSVKKTESGDGENKTIIYDLTMKEKDSTTTYEYSADYVLSTEKYNYTVSFDEEAGVNRPIVSKNMTALMKDGTLVNDIYKDNWYSYKKGSTSFARIKTADDKIYVWIPRFAYSIQSFYNGREAKDVPSTAISIVFLRETSNYMINDEVMPSQYEVHPAFNKNGVEYSGIWVEESAINKVTNYGGISITNADLHIMENKEYLATIYLMYYLEALEEVKFEKPEYVDSLFYGDVNGDKKITSLDVTKIQDYVARYYR